MTFSKGQSSGRGNAFLGSALGKTPAPAKARKTLERKSPKRLGSEADDGRRNQATHSTLSRGKRKVKPGGPDAGAVWRQACLERNVAEFGHATCEATGLHLQAGWSCHHVIEASVLNAMGFASSEFIVWHPDNGMCVNRKPHLDHHNWSPRITADRLRDWHWDFARMLDDTQGTEAFSLRLAADYPEGRET